MNNTTYTLDDIIGFEKRFRTTFINSLSGFKTPVLIGTINNEGQTNLAIFNSLLHLGAMPPLIGLIIRPDSVERHTLQNILSTKAFTINHIQQDFYKQAHQTSARYGKEESEFDKTGLTREYKSDSIAPYVKESSIKLSAEFIERIDLVVNGTILLIGKIKNIHLPKHCIHQDGFVALEKAGSIAVSGLDSYYQTSSIARLTYAKVDQPTAELNSFLID